VKIEKITSDKNMSKKVTTKTYREIFNSTVLTGGAQFITILIGVVRVKALALILGPVGVGIFGMYHSATWLIETVSGLGISRAGVRQIAEAYGDNSEKRISLTAKVVQRVSMITGIIGLLFVFVGRERLSIITFGDKEHIWGFGIISICLLFNSIFQGNLALLRGMRKIRYMAACQVTGSLLGSFFSIVLVYHWEEKAIASYLVVLSFFSFISSFIYVSKLKISPIVLKFKDFIKEAKELLNIGFAFMLSGLLPIATIYFSRVFISYKLGVEAVGLFTAVTTLSMVYVNMILQAMTSDYYPRLAAISTDNSAIKKMANEQVEMGLLFAVPGILAMISLAPMVLKIFYSQEFCSATSVIRWYLVGVMARVFVYPLGIILPAKKLTRIMVILEFFSGVIQILSLIYCLEIWGLDGAGISYMISSMIYMVFILFIVGLKAGFKFSKRTLVLGGISIVLATINYNLVLWLPFVNGTWISFFVSFITLILSIYMIKKNITGCVSFTR